MPKYSVRFHQEAVKESEKSQGWYLQRNPVAAYGFVNELSHAIEMVANSPERWPKYKSGTRRYIFPRYPFSLIYRINKNIIEVLAIAHQKKRPDYWAKR